MNEEQVSKLSLIRKNIQVNKDTFHMIIFGDLHIGHQSCDEREIGKMVNWIAKEDPKEFGVILTGDLIENVIPSSKGLPFEMKYPSPTKQMEVATKMLLPISKHIHMLCDGNHEDRSQKTAGISPSYLMAKDLNE